ncbi:integrase domain-containing protein [Modicisalibacter sp. 'Wilcox']|uniref:integrase domain-containing protein n=1 Tax=Modicisalibacter sp. 'Wilcox' TaxID=2679914 RepID=UPI0013D196E7|nr:integrase domain-containing protein [Modicisalibacter sp. 'Wilcox']
MANNFGLQTRDLAKAGGFAANRAAREGDASYETAAALGNRWQPFAAYAKSEGVRRMEHVTALLLAAYGQDIAARVAAGELSASYGQNLVSAVNTIMRLASQGQWQSVSPTKDCGIEQRSNVRQGAPQGIERDAVSTVTDGLCRRGQPRGAAVVELARELGLRSKEASLIDARIALRQAQRDSKVSITSGTKGGRARTVPITSKRQVEVLSRAVDAQAGARSLVPPELSWQEWREGGRSQVPSATRDPSGTVLL